MTTPATTQPQARALPDLNGGSGRLGQSTAIEQSRAIAEVQAAIVVAQQCPRSITAAVEMMRESCRQKALAERAFYRFPRAGTTVTGPTVHLARELARCWGNVQYGVTELRRDDGHGQSEMQAFAWDVQTNTRSMQIFIVPHKRDTQQGPKQLVDMRDVYENNANMGARRLREAIYAILPPWFVEEAKDLCTATLADGGGAPLAKRVSDAIAAYDALGVSADQVEQRLGRPRDRWTDHDLAQLHVTYKSLQRGEVTIDEEFPPRRVSAAQISEQHAGTPAQAEPPPPPPAEPPPADDNDASRARLSPQGYAQLREAGIDDSNRAALTRVATDGRTDTTTDLTAVERRRILNAAAGIRMGVLELVVDGPGGEPMLLDVARDLPLPGAQALDEPMGPA